MKALFRYLLRGKRSILRTVLLSAAAMLLVGLAIFLYYFSSIMYVYHDLMGDLSPEDFAAFIRFVPGDFMEFASLAVLTVSFTLLCGKAFRIGTANGVSRSVLIKTLLASALGISAAATVINQSIRLVLVSVFPYFSNASVFTSVFGTERYDWREDAELLPFLNLRAALFYFGAACLLLTAVCCLYALYRRFGGTGVLCGSLVTVMVWVIFAQILSPFGKLTTALHRLFFHDAVVIGNAGLHMKLLPPKALPLTATMVILIAAYAAVFAAAMRKTGIRPVH